MKYVRVFHPSGRFAVLICSGQISHDPFDDPSEEDLQLLGSGRGYGLEYRYAAIDAIDAIEEQAMQMNIQIIPGYPCPSPRWGQPTAVQNRSRRFCGGRAETLDKRNSTGLCLGAFQASLLGQKGRNGAVNYL